jgi:hypothetical protein
MKLKTIDHAILALLEREGATKDNPYETSNRKTAEAIGYGAYQWTNSQRYVSHTVETSITAQPNWLVGEVKDCLSPVLHCKTAPLFKQETGYVASSLNCDNGPSHTIKVTIHAPLLQPEHKSISWRCTRETEGFSCEQTGAE